MIYAMGYVEGSIDQLQCGICTCFISLENLQIHPLVLHYLADVFLWIP